MVETIVRIVQVILISLVVVYYAYLLRRAWVILKQNRKNPTDESVERIALLKRKLVPTICYSLCMAAAGVLYLVGIDIGVMAYGLIFLSIIVASVGDKRILSKAELKKKK